MSAGVPHVNALRTLSRDGWLLFGTRFLRLFGYGLISVVLVQMDVPTRQAYTMAVVSPDERSAASGITTVARSLGAAIPPAIATRLIAIPSLVSLPLLLAGGIKILYDLALWRAFAKHIPHGEGRPDDP